MRNCIFCDVPSCPNNGIDLWVDECAYFPSKEMDEDERRNFEEYEDELAQQEE